MLSHFLNYDQSLKWGWPPEWVGESCFLRLWCNVKFQHSLLKNLAGMTGIFSTGSEGKVPGPSLGRGGAKASNGPSGVYKADRVMYLPDCGVLISEIAVEVSTAHCWESVLFWGKRILPLLLTT